MKKQVLIVRLCCLFALIVFAGSGAIAQSFTLSAGAQSPNPVRDGNTCTFVLTSTRSSGSGNFNGVAYTFIDNSQVDTATFSTPTTNATTNVCTLTVFVTNGIPAGLYPLQINAKKGNDIWSTVVQVNVCNVIASNPQAQTACEGTPATFSVTASSSVNATYQWRRNGVNLVASPSYAGVNASTLTINSVATGDAGNYDVIVGNSCGTDTSSAAALTVNTLPTVSCPATSLLFVPDPGQCGQNVSYSATATGSPSPTISYSPASGAFYNVGSYTATATASNICGSNTCTISFKVAEDVLPVVQKCVDPITSCNPQVFWTAPLFSDNCGIQTIVSTHSPNSTFPLGTTIVTYTAFDSSGNSVDCSFDVTITAPPRWYVDADGDGYGSSTSSQVSCTQPSGYADNANDCNDSTAAINPGAQEICDAGVDNDCDGLTDDNDSTVTGQITYYADSDGDNFGDSGASLSSCSQPNGYVLDNSDCDDTDSDINPAAQEICDNGIDNDCDGVADDADTNVAGQVTWYADSDGDTFGDTDDNLSACIQPSGYVLDDGDCNDSNTAINPDAQEICNSIDDDCDNNIDDNDASVVGQTTWYADLDTDSYGDASASQVSCFQPAGYVSDNTDCDDGDVSISPAATEICDNIDNDCDGTADDGLTFVNYYTDADGDTYGTGTAQSLCNNPGAGFSTQAGDCDDSNAATNPAATEICDGVDNDCDGALDSADPNFVDTTAPVAPSIADATGECGVTITAPTATDNCAGSITGTTSDPLSYSAQGTYIITWTFDDGNGNSSTATQNVIVDDVTAPAAPSIADATGECGVTVTAPTATDNCAGSITGTTSDPLSYSAQGTYTITWTFDDGNGNSSTATQTVIVDDVTAPAAPSIADATGECGVTVTAPTATDNCSGSITGTTTDALSYSAQGTYTITWTFSDGNGNSSTATQNVIVDDVTAPVAPPISTVTGQCSASVTAPVGIDNCAGSIVATTADPLTYSTQGTYTVTWTFNDGNGNTSTATQTVIVNDNILPVISGCPSNITKCGAVATWTAPTASDNCSLASLTSSHAPGSSFPVGTTTVTYTATDVAGNVSTCSFNVTITASPVWYADADGDGYGNAANSQAACTQPSGYVSNATDCDDNNAAISPAGTEVCNGIDDDCDGAIDDNVSIPSLGSISGTSQLCISAVPGSAIYSVTPNAEVSLYSWTVPVGMTITSGQGTPTISVSWPGSALQAGIAGFVTMTPSTSCGLGAPVKLFVDINSTIPVRPGSISGTTRICPGDTGVYSVAAVTRAAYYVWTLPANMTIVQGAGTNTIKVLAQAGFAGGTMEVSAANACGISPSRTKSIALNVPLTPGVITGLSSGLCGAVGNVFTTSGSSAASSYTWTAPVGVTIVSGQGTNSITVNVSSSFTSGTLTVVGVNGCGNSGVRSLTISGTPGQAGPISGPVTVCPGSTGVGYGVATVTGAQTYTWTLPSGLTAAAGQGTKNILVDFSLTPATNLVISMRSSNACGQSPIRSLSGISVSTVFCARSSTGTGLFSDADIYPNPASDRIFVQFNSEKAADYTLTLTDMAGRNLFVEQATSQEGANVREFDVSGLTSGAYLVTIMAENTRQVMRLIVE